MILGDIELNERIMRGGLVRNIGADQINPASVNLRLGDTWLTPIQLGGKSIRLGDEVKYERVQSDSFVLMPGKFVLATTVEKVLMPTGLSGFVQGRSSIGRIGLTTQNAGFIDPGFHGHITLELVNESPNPIELVSGYPVAQVVFISTSPVQKPYRGKYNEQIEATGSRMCLDKEGKKGGKVKK